MNIGTRIPPSNSDPFPWRSGRLSVTREAPPLSEAKMNRVRLAIPKLATALRSRPAARMHTQGKTSPDGVWGRGLGFVCELGRTIRGTTRGVGAAKHT